MTTTERQLREALDALLWSVHLYCRNKPIGLVEAEDKSRRALALPESPSPSTHSEDCWRWHLDCAVARAERAEQDSERRLTLLRAVEQEADELRSTLASVQARLERLAESLEHADEFLNTHGDHALGCGYDPAGLPCDCGYDALLAELLALSPKPGGEG